MAVAKKPTQAKTKTSKAPDGVSKSGLRKTVNAVSLDLKSKKPKAKTATRAINKTGDFVRRAQTLQAQIQLSDLRSDMLRAYSQASLEIKFLSSLKVITGDEQANALLLVCRHDLGNPDKWSESYEPLLISQINRMIGWLQCRAGIDIDGIKNQGREEANSDRIKKARKTIAENSTSLELANKELDDVIGARAIAIKKDKPKFSVNQIAIKIQPDLLGDISDVQNRFGVKIRLGKGGRLSKRRIQDIAAKAINSCGSLQ